MTSDPSPLHRVALYFAPACPSDWWTAGSAWLGRCALTDQPRLQPAVPGWTPAAFAALTAEPRRYGWHATLKAPFRLAPGQTLQGMRQAVRALCQGRPAFELPPLQVSTQGQFLALRPLSTLPALERLAADAVRQLHPWAAPLTAEELAHRRRAPLSAAQDALLQAWGYPHVMDQFRFHLSLTGALRDVPADALADLLAAAADHFRHLPPCRVDRVSLFVEPAPGAPMRLLEQVVFEP